MKRNQKANRPYARTRKSIRNSAGENASALANAAGATTRPTVEQLEARQMLFSLTVTNENIMPGVGQVAAQFGYVIPYLAPTTAPDDLEDPEVIDEDFNDEVDPQLPVNGVPLPSPVLFNDSNLVVYHTIPSQSNARLMPVNGDPDDGALRFRMQDGEQFSFRFSAADGEIGPFRGVSAVTASFSADGGPGYSLDNLRVTLRFGGVAFAIYEGQDIAAFAVGATPTTLEGQFDFDPGTGDVFDEIVFQSIDGTTNPAFLVDDVIFDVPSNRYLGIMEDRLYGVAVTLTGPVGATAQFLDLYGNDMVGTLALGTPDNVDEILIVDRNVDGIPDFNDGWGSVILNNTDANTSITAYGGTVDLVDGVFVFSLVEDLDGFFDDFEGAGGGYRAVIDQAGTAWVTDGLPSIGGSIIFGDANVRESFDYNPGGVSTGESDFNRANQGIFVLGGGAMGSVNIHGVVHGSSRFEGAVDRISVGYLVGSISVQGDLGSLVVGTDAGMWVVDNDGSTRMPRNKTGGQLIVDRTVGEIAIGGRSLMDVTVVGAINTPAASPARDVYRYIEKEFMFAIDPTEEEVVVLQASMFNTWGHALDNLLSKSGEPYFRLWKSVV